jgi:hypothetical protein
MTEGRGIAGEQSRAEQFRWAEGEVGDLRGRYCLKFRHFLDRFAVGSSRAGRYLRSLIITAFVALKFE